MDVHLPKCGFFFGWWPSPPAGSQRGHNLTSLTHESATNGSLPAPFLVSKATTQTLSKPVILTYFDSTHGLGLLILVATSPTSLLPWLGNSDFSPNWLPMFFCASGRPTRRRSSICLRPSQLGWCSFPQKRCYHTFDPYLNWSLQSQSDTWNLLVFHKSSSF